MKTKDKPSNEKETLESYKARVHLKQVHTNYRWAMALLTLTVLVVGLVVGYFVAINQVVETNARIVNSIEVSLKDPTAQQ